MLNVDQQFLSDTPDVRIVNISCISSSRPYCLNLFRLCANLDELHVVCAGSNICLGASWHCRVFWVLPKSEENQTEGFVGLS